MADSPLQVVLCWHMHQPDYHDPLTGRSQAPWTYLHAIKDYTDMAAHLERHPQVQAVVNFSAVLLDQLADYGQELRQLIEGKGTARDPLLAALYGAAAPDGPDMRIGLVRACLHANRRHMIERFPRFRILTEMGRWALANPAAQDYVSDVFLSDLIVWYHLAWLGETVRRDDPVAIRLMARERHFTLHDRYALVELIQQQVASVIPRYRALSERGQVELSVTPYSHPILPLMLDFSVAREAWPDCPLPSSGTFPGGEGRARWQLQAARRSFVRHFQQAPGGCWPAEGGVSAALLPLVEEAGFRWVATGQAVLRNSLAEQAPDSDRLHRPYRLQAQGPACFFRDDELSDLIGFEYKDWHGDDAVANLIHRLEKLADAGADGRVVPIILDGENAWEHYPDNALHFLGGLYERLSSHPRIRTTTFTRVLDEAETPVARLDRLVAGSWVYGSFSTWIGEDDKNRAWDLLVAAKHAYDRHRADLPPDRAEAADRRMAACECSDWFWWMGSENQEEVVSQFEHLFRLHLTALYRSLGQVPPEELTRVFAHGSAHGASANMRPSTRG